MIEIFIAISVKIFVLFFSPPRLFMAILLMLVLVIPSRFLGKTPWSILFVRIGLAVLMACISEGLHASEAYSSSERNVRIGGGWAFYTGLDAMKNVGLAVIAGVVLGMVSELFHTVVRVIAKLVKRVTKI